MGYFSDRNFDKESAMAILVISTTIGVVCGSLLAVCLMVNYCPVLLISLAMTAMGVFALWFLFEAMFPKKGMLPFAQYENNGNYKPCAITRWLKWWFGHLDPARGPLLMVPKNENSNRGS